MRASRTSCTRTPGAPHSFFDRKAAEFAEESADAWRRVQAFIGQRTDTGVIS